MNAKDDYVQYRIQRAHETIQEIQVLIDNKLWNTAINRMYYACFYAVGALLIKNGIEVVTHAGCRQKFGELFILTEKIDRKLGKFYSELFEKRQKGDYNDFFDVDEETVLNLYPMAKDFVVHIKKVINQVID